MTQTEPRTISIPIDALYQYFTKEHLDWEEQLTEDQWEDFLDQYQSAFAREATAISREMMDSFLEDLN